MTVAELTVSLNIDDDGVEHIDVQMNPDMDDRVVTAISMLTLATALQTNHWINS